MPSTSAIVNIVRHEFDLHFQGHELRRIANDLLTAAENKAPSALRCVDISATSDTLDRRLFERFKKLFILDEIVLVLLQSCLADR